MPEALFDCDMRRSALLSACGLYRYVLTRSWDDAKPRICWIMLNPSIADAQIDDPTIRRIVGFSLMWDYGTAYVVNLFALRSTDPANLFATPHPISEPGRPQHNDEAISCAVENAAIVAAWGAHGGHMERNAAVMKLLGNRQVQCLGTTMDGNPKHPLYLKSDTIRRPFSMMKE